jgi:ABC-type transport system involved in multi-copper enzyme maturation permease subunit
MSRETATTLLRYRPYRGSLRGPLAGSLAMARASLKLMFRRWLYWGLFALSALVFFFFFYGQYLVVWITTQFGEDSVPIAGMKVPMKDFTKFLGRLALDGSAHTFGNFIWFEGYVVVIVLALAGSLLVGNDFARGSLPFYLSKPIGRRHYVLGKCLAIGFFVNLATTIPAFILWIEAGLLYDWKSYYLDNADLLLGVLGYGFVLTVSLSLLVMATAVWLRRTVPMTMVWMGVFVLLRMLASWLVDGLKVDEHWRLLDLWNDLYLVGAWCLQIDPATIRPAEQPKYWEAALTVGGVCIACLLYLRKRIQAVEIVS